MATLADIHSLTDYMREYGEALASKVEQQHKPLFMPGQDWHPKLYKSLRVPFQGQGDAVMAVVETLKRQDAVMVIGEMGTGKTTIGVLAAWVGMDFPKVLVMCPSHLTEKWVREIKAIIPGVEASVIRNLSDAMAADAEAATARGPRFWVVSKETGKLSYRWKPAVKTKDKTFTVLDKETKQERLVKKTLVYCPVCGKIQTDRDSAFIEYDAVKRRKHWCSAAQRVKIDGHWEEVKDKDGKPVPCGHPLWQADSDGIRRYAIADYFKKHLPNFFDFFIADEVHELKGSDTAQGNAFGALASAAKKTICLTGTLLGGYSSHLFYLNYRIAAALMKQDGFDYCRPSKFVDKYGIKEVVTRTSHQQEGDDNKNSKGKSYSKTVSEKPGISPELFAHQLIDKAVFLHLEDVSDALPPFIEDVVGVRMDPELEAAYNLMENKIGDAMRRLLRAGSKRLLGTFLVNLLSYPDRPFDNEPIFLDKQWLVPPELSKTETYAKELKLRRLIERELSEGRKCLVYATFTQSRDVTKRIRDVLEKTGIKVAILNNVNPKKREAWFAEQVKKGVQVVITNPELVKTGLDLLDFPTIIYYQTGYSIFTLRQASRRSWRIGQTKEVRVFYFYYENTMQARAVKLVGKKLNASLAIEGKLTDEGLISMSDSEDGAIALAKSLQEGGISGVEEVWKQLRRKNEGTTRRDTRPDPERVSPDLGATVLVEVSPDFETVQTDTDVPQAEIATAAELPGTIQPTVPSGAVYQLPFKPMLYLPPGGSGADTGGEEPSADPHKRVRNVAAKRSTTVRRKSAPDPRRMDPGADWGPDYKWTKAGWRRISEREKLAAIRREEERLANAWKYEEDVNPGDGYRWQRSYSYNHYLSGKLVTVRGHWRRCKCKAQTQD